MIRLLEILCRTNLGFFGVYGFLWSRLFCTGATTDAPLLGAVSRRELRGRQMTRRWLSRPMRGSIPIRAPWCHAAASESRRNPPAAMAAWPLRPPSLCHHHRTIASSPFCIDRLLPLLLATLALASALLSLVYIRREGSALIHRLPWWPTTGFFRTSCLHHCRRNRKKSNLLEFCCKFSYYYLYLLGDMDPSNRFES